MIKSISSFIICLILYSSFPTAHASASKNCAYKYRPAEVELTGKVVTKRFYGAPGFGENPATDRKETVFLLQLSKPIDIKAEKNDPINVSFSKINSIQLFDNTSLYGQLDKVIGKKVMLKGILDSAMTGHDHTEVILTVLSIEKTQAATGACSG